MMILTCMSGSLSPVSGKLGMGVSSLSNKYTIDR